MEQSPQQKTANQSYRDNLAQKIYEKRAEGNAAIAQTILDQEKQGFFYQEAQSEHREGSQLEARQNAFVKKVASMQELAAKLGLEISVAGLPEKNNETKEPNTESVPETKPETPETDGERFIRVQKEKEAKLAEIGIDNVLGNVADSVQETDGERYIRVEKAAEAKLAEIGVENVLNEKTEVATEKSDDLSIGEELLQKTENLTTPNFVANFESDVVSKNVVENTDAQSQENSSKEKLAAAIVAANAAALAAERNSATRNQAGIFRAERNDLVEKYKQETGEDFYATKKVEEKEDKKNPKGFLAGLFNRNKGLQESHPKGDGFLKRNWKKIGLAAGLLFVTMPGHHAESASHDTIVDDIENTRNQERKERLRSTIEMNDGDGVTQIMKRALDMNESMLRASGLPNTNPETMKNIGENLHVIDKETGKEIRLTAEVIGGKALVSYDKEAGFSIILNVGGKMIDARLEGIVGVSNHAAVKNYEYSHADAKVTQTNSDTVTINNLFN